MNSLVAGQRLDLGTSGAIVIDVSRNTGRAALAAIMANGSVVPLVREEAGRWRLEQPHLLPDTAEIVLYPIDERTDVSATDMYPITVAIGDVVHQLPQPEKRLGLVVVGEIYEKGGRHRMRIGNDGYSYGVDAYARKKNIEPSTLPFRTPLPSSAPDGGSVGGPRRSPDRTHHGQLVGSGSGILVAPKTIVTNAHVVENGTAFLAGPRRVPLDLLAVDPIHDLAVLRGDVKGECLRIRAAATTWLGEPIIAAGYPLVDLLGADLKVSMGNVSGLAGAHGDVSRFQFTAPIGSGSSGGAVADEFGNLVGVTSAALAHAEVRDRGAVSENMNFGIKATLVREILASAGIDVPSMEGWTEGGRREAVARLRSAVMNIGVLA